VLQLLSVNKKAINVQMLNVNTFGKVGS